MGFRYFLNQGTLVSESHSILGPPTALTSPGTVTAPTGFQFGTSSTSRIRRPRCLHESRDGGRDLVTSPTATLTGFGARSHGTEAEIGSNHDYIRTKTVWHNASEDPGASPYVMR